MGSSQAKAYPRMATGTYEKRVQYWVNRKRNQHDLRKLRIAGCTDTSAEQWSSYLARNDLFYHQEMSDLLDVVSDARHATHGRLPVLPESTDVGALVRSAVSDLCASHSWPPVEVEAADGVVAEVDPVRVRQVIANLLGNAVKFGTRAWVSVRAAAASFKAP